MRGGGHGHRPVGYATRAPRRAREPATEDEGHPQDEEADVPADRGAEVVPDVVDLQEVVVDQPLHDVEDAPTGQHQPDVEAPRRR